ncbi:hypothetical protein D3C74_03410 [compost metagenome]
MISLQEQLTEEQRHLVDQAMRLMDGLYDDEQGLLQDEEAPERHDTRSSVHYALGLLMRAGEGDITRACTLLHQVMDLQFDLPDEIYHGTFRQAPELPVPPAGHYAWKKFAPGFAYFWDDTLEKIGQQLSIQWSKNTNMGSDAPDSQFIIQSLRDAADKVIPRVWRSYDPNWREFIACAFAIILEHFEQILPSEVVVRMDDCMVKTVGASIDRLGSDAIPMNTNIELMHIFAVHYFGYRLDRQDWQGHAQLQAERLLAEFREFGSFAEFNTTTYYGVDLTVLGMWRCYGRTDALKGIGAEIEEGLWRNIALFYNPELENVSGPFARAYEMEMLGHSSMGVFIYLALGQDYKHLTLPNCETSHDPMIALVGVNVPEDVRQQLAVHAGDRRVDKQFRELCERNKPGENRHLCTASAWIERTRMIGAMSGSRNTNGQMHPATIHWKTDNGDKYYARLIRREKGKGWNTHLRGIIFDAEVEKDRLAVEVSLDTELDTEVYFEIEGPGLSRVEITAESWRLPGLSCKLHSKAPHPYFIRTDNRIEIVYSHYGTDVNGHMSFDLELDPVAE